MSIQKSSRKEMSMFQTPCNEEREWVREDGREVEVEERVISTFKTF